MSIHRRFLKGWISTIIGLIVIVSAVAVLAVINTFHLIIQLVILAGGFSVGAWLLGMDDELIKSFLNIHKLDVDKEDDNDNS